uniref:Elongation of fatty acids protein n=1 Tax=Albugo laibachii Nc14 TaxID=890382 RepID=F0WSW4_9STRA|nr:Crinkler (CRN) family protein putative [Albugo laibachii Nc14]|eukprot:CCA24448.1 Crinkler (CRN) family protein putative [Albugo laibachii Nc14]
MRHYPLADFATAIAICVGYISFVMFGTIIMKAACPRINTRPIQFLYNPIQVVLCSYMCVEAGIQAYRHGYSLMPCNAYNHRKPVMGNVLYMFYLSKILDFTDTVFIVLGKKWNQLSFLHVYHHLTIFLVYFLNLRLAYDGDVYATIILNGFIHAIMYMYYFVSAHTRDIWWKKYLTTLQMTQFVLMNVQGYMTVKRSCEGMPPLEEDSLIGTRGGSKKDAFIVVVPVKEQQNDTKISNLRQDVVWHGMCGSIGRGEDIDLKDERTLSRSTLTADIIHRLEKMHVILVNSPPMTEKTSLATLVSLALVNRHKQENRKEAIFNFSALGISMNETFEDAFKQQCELSWTDARSTLPSQGYMVYMVLDEAQVIYREGTSSPRHKTTVFWEHVKYVLNNAAYNVRILMFAAYDSGVEYMHLSTPIQFDEIMMFTIKELNFSHDEVQEYVNKWFAGIAFLKGSSGMESFCANLEGLTGGHVGLCVTAINTLNEVYFSRRRSGSELPSTVAWIRMLQSGSLYRPNDNALFDTLTSTRAVKIFQSLDTEELDRLERIAYGTKSASDDDIVEQCVRKGILFQTERRYTFSSPVMC